jgi:nicotinate-nucleotide adenylyltransferase
MGGSFDPVHVGHLRVAEEALRALRLDRVVFVTSYCPPHKSQEQLTPAEHRHAMVGLAVEGYPCFFSSKTEIERGCPTFAGDTIREFRDAYPEWQIYFITGLDAVLKIVRWDTARTLPGLCQLIAVTRPGYARQEVEQRIPPAFKSDVIFLEVPGLDVSSTQVREGLKQGKPVDGLIPETVKKYIFEHGLYGASKVQ